MKLQLSKKSPLLWIYLGGALLLVVAAVLWCVKFSVGPERVFWQTIAQGLATRGVTVSAEQTNNGTTANQHIRYSMGSENRSHSVTVLQQGNTTVKNEMISSPTVDYTRYVDVKTDQKRADGSPIDFSKLLGVWAVGQEGGGQFFSQAVFGASLPVGGIGVPLGNVNAKDRTAIVKQVRDDNVYQIDFAKTKKERVNGRLQYTYEATVKPSAYISLIKKFAQSLNIHGLDQVDPNDYKTQQPFKILVTVDVRSHHVVSIASGESGGKQTYSSYDVPVQIDLPKNAITGKELQQRLSDLQ